MKPISHYLVALFCGAVVAGCATTPPELRGEFTDIAPDKVADEHLGEPVRWGGRLLDIRPERERTCFEILAFPLDRNARPLTASEPGGRFIACRPGFTDPAALTDRDRVTVTGEITDFKERAIGDYDYVFPVVSAAHVQIWPQVVELEPRYHDRFYDPHWRHDPFYGAIPRYRRIPPP